MMQRHRAKGAPFGAPKEKQHNNLPKAPTVTVTALGAAPGGGST